MKVKHLEKNEVGRDFVCGDIHGSYSCVQRFLDEIKFDASKDRLISVGDLVDRGPENEKCLGLLYEPWFHSVKGNHEELMQEFFYYYKNNPARENWWEYNGGGWGRHHYRNDTEEAVLTCDALERFIKTLPYILTVDMQNGGKFHVLHAELWKSKSSDVDITDEALANEEFVKKITASSTLDGNSITWGRYVFQQMYKTKITDHLRKKIERRTNLERLNRVFNDRLSHMYSGHTIVADPVQFYGQTNLDTGAYKSYEPANIDSGLTATEPLTKRFWLSSDREFKETQPVVFK